MHRDGSEVNSSGDHTLGFKSLLLDTMRPDCPGVQLTRAWQDLLPAVLQRVIFDVDS